MLSFHGSTAFSFLFSLRLFLYVNFKCDGLSTPSAFFEFPLSAFFPFYKKVFILVLPLHVGGRPQMTDGA